MRRILLLLVLLFATTAHLYASETPAERAANHAAQHELDTSPPNGNVPSYSLNPADLAKGNHLESVRDTLHFSEAIWGVLQLVLLLSLGVIRRFREAVVRRFKNRWLQGYGFLFLFLLVTTLLSLPIDIYGHWLRRSYGLSVQSWGAGPGIRRSRSASHGLSAGCS